MGANNRIVLISSYCSDYIGIRSIYFHLLSKHYDVYLIYFQEFEAKYPPSNKDYETLINTIQAISPSIIGISIASYASDIAFKITKMIRQKINVLIVFGGIHPMVHSDECIKYADVICVWEGEESFSKLCEKYFNDEDYTDIPNLWIKQKDRIIKNPIKIIEKLDSLSLPNFNSKNFIYINNGIFFKGRFRLFRGNQYFIMTARGCPNRCTYCINNILSKKIDSTSYKGKYIRRRSVKNVIDELKLVKNHFNIVGLIRICDDIFSIDLEWLKEFCGLYKKYINIPFWCNLHINFVNQEIITLLKTAGLDHCNIGIESGSQRIRYQVYNKFISDENISKIAKLLNKNKVKYSFNIIRDNPLESDNDLKDGAKFLLSLPRPLKLDLLSLVNFPGTELTERLLKEGLIKKADTLVTDCTPMRILRTQTYNDTKKQYWFYIYNFIPKSFIPKFLIIFLTKDIFVKHPKFLVSIFEIGNKIYQLKEKL